jgi:imidazole glycerol-phosphate synthase subunit HisH
MADDQSIAVVATGVANVASVLAGLRRTGFRTRTICSPTEVYEAASLVLPGVGAFGAAMQRLAELKLAEPLRRRIEEGRPTLAICLGLQMFAAASDESPGVSGLSIFENRIERLSAPRVPQLGWNWVEADPQSRFLSSGYAYYANSFCLRTCPPGWTASWTDYGDPIVAAIERGSVLACQFHPELSGPWGQQLLRRWLETNTVLPLKEPTAC